MAVRSKRSHEGYLLIDSRHAPTPAAGELPVIRTTHECATLTCSHCHLQMMVNPLRTRERGYCPKCDHYVCDGCEAIRAKTGECFPLNARLDQMQENAEKTGSYEPMVTLK